MGLFITFEGIEGSGKSTQIGLLKYFLESRGRSVVTVREPGGTVAGERIRPLLLESTEEALAPGTELFLYEAARAELVSRVIGPALESGKTVISDRFVDSTIAYQGYGRGFDIGAIRRLNDVAIAGHMPDVTFLLDLPPEDGLRRAWARIDASVGKKEDRFEKEAMSFHTRVRSGYLEIAEREPDRVRVIDASAEIASIHASVCDIMNKTVLSDPWP